MVGVVCVYVPCYKIVHKILWKSGSKRDISQNFFLVAAVGNLKIDLTKSGSTPIRRQVSLSDSKVRYITSLSVGTWASVGRYTRNTLRRYTLDTRQWTSRRYTFIPFRSVFDCVKSCVKSHLFLSEVYLTTSNPNQPSVSLWLGRHGAGRS